MKRRVLWILGCIVLVVLVGLAILNRPRPPLVTFGPHTTGIKFVPFAEANPKPWFDLNLPIFGRVRFPNGTPIDGVDPNDDSRFVVGYLQVDAGGAFWVKGWSYRGDWFGDKRTTLKVVYPGSEEDGKRPAYVQAGDESIAVYRVFDPTKIPARAQSTTVKSGDLEITARFAGYDWGPEVELKFSIPGDYGSLQLESKTAISSSSSSMTGPFPTRHKVPGNVTKKNEIVVEFEVAYSVGSKPLGPKKRIRIVLPVAAPGAIKSA